MARRIEITVPNDVVPMVRSIISDPDKCNIQTRSGLTGVPGMINEISMGDETLFLITVPGKNVQNVLKNMDKRQIGVKIGTLSLQSLDCFKPRFVRHRPVNDDDENKRGRGKTEGGSEKITRRVSHMISSISNYSKFRDFRKPPLTLDEVYGMIVSQAHMTTTTWINLIGASVVGAGGAVTNNIVFVVAAMLVSPIMGPVLGMAFAYRVADWKLLWESFKNLILQSVAAWLVGFLIILPLSLYNSEAKRWSPSPETILAYSDETNLIFSSVLSCASGVILGNAVLKTSGSNSLVGVAITAGLLPPVVFSGMLFSFGLFHANDNDPDFSYYRDAKVSFLAFLVHLFCIALFANILFFLKDINPRFRELDDLPINDRGSTFSSKSEQSFNDSSAFTPTFAPKGLSSWWGNADDDDRSQSTFSESGDRAPSTRLPFETVEDMHDGTNAMHSSNRSPDIENHLS